jgi:hypothetical protein
MISFYIFQQQHYHELSCALQLTQLILGYQVTTVEQLIDDVHYFLHHEISTKQLPLAGDLALAMNILYDLENYVIDFFPSPGNTSLVVGRFCFFFL